MKKVILDDMILTRGLPTAAGSKMLEGYMSLFDAQVVSLLQEGGFAITGKADVGEFAIDLVGETAYNGAKMENGVYVNAAAEAVKSGEADASVGLDVNGSIRRAAAQAGLVSIKPTYGTVSRFGTIPVACSGETVSVTAKTVADCREVLDAIAGHDDKDGTSHDDGKCALIKSGAAFSPISKVAVIAPMCEGLDEAAQAKFDAFCEKLSANGIAVEKVDSKVIPAARVAWNILMSAELCNNVSRYDGIKYGYRTENFTNIDELYTNSRTEAFGDLLKTAILFGSETLSTENYWKQYDKSLRIRRLVVEAFAELFESYDAVVIPTCSAVGYTPAMVEANPYIAYDENFYTAPASITGLPCVVVGGVQLIGKAFSDQALLDLAEKEA